MSEISYKTALEALLPGGSLWRAAKLIEQSSVVGTELITNGTFDTNIDGWIDSSIGPPAAFITWDSGTMQLFTAPA